jgi:hypothetical protein
MQQLVDAVIEVICSIIVHWQWATKHDDDDKKILWGVPIDVTF